MMARREILVSLGGMTSMLALGGCGLLDTHYRYRYKMTVEIETPGGLKTGTSVQEQSVTKYYMQDMAGNIRDMQTRGEAVAVDLPDGQMLFALLCEASLIQSVLDPLWKNDWVESGRRITSGETPETVLVVAPTRSEIAYENGVEFTKVVPHYPKLVRFRDIHDPKSVEMVDPDDVAASFSAGVRLKRITLQLTDEKVTSGLRSRLPWLTVYPEPRLKPASVQRNLPSEELLTFGDFISGGTK